ncbi:biliverdin-producing heme oxygenase [Deinococcus hopiensis]|nr:biliverdin-producing heme oxygenase [Deinococcus hopiensis]
MAHLKQATRERHAEVEALMPVLDPALTQAAYIRLLRQLLGVVAPLEAQLLELPIPAAFGLEHRLRAPLLVRDLIALSAPTPVWPTRGMPAAPRLSGLGQGLGTLYVLEGSTLGGQVIGRHLRVALDITAEWGGAYFHAHGEGTGAMWRAFGEALNLWEGDAEEVVAGANLTFGAFADALRGVPA